MDGEPRPSIDNLRGESEMHREIELKIGTTPPIEGFTQRVTRISGELHTPQTLLVDESFKRPKDAPPIEITVQAGEDQAHEGGSWLRWQTRDVQERLAFPNSIEQLRKVLMLLGITPGEQLRGTPPKRTARIRQNGNEVIFTVKELRDKTKTIANRPEEEVFLKDTETIKTFLRTLGYIVDAHREKRRTKFRLPDGTILDYDEFPNGVPPLAEIEGTSEEKVQAALAALGFTEKDIFIGSNEDWLLAHGVTKDAARDFRFE